MSKTIKPTPSAGQVKFFNLLRDRARAQKSLTREDIAKATGWKLSTVRTYITEGHFSTVLIEQDEELIPTSTVLAKSDAQLKVLISQSQIFRKTTSDLSLPLAQILSERSRDNMLLSLETYNRPSLANKVDSFTVLFCMAWEQILKATIMERDGEKSIYSGKLIGSRNKSISLQECLDKVFKSTDAVYKNILYIKNLRDEAVHLLVQETQPVLSRIFQAGVLNYTDYYFKLTGLPFLEPSAPGLLALVSDGKDLEDAAILTRYGKSMGSDILSIIKEARSEVSSNNSIGFSIPLTYTLKFAVKNEDPDIELTTGSPSSVSAIVIEKAVSEFKIHKMSRGQVVSEISEKLRRVFSRTDYADRGVIDSAGAPRFTTGHFERMCSKEGWKKSNNKYHKMFPEMNNTRRYSNAVVEFVFDGINSSKTFMAKYK